mmetsp:Transcript_34540/g.82864  ORF Transcript_34540/g.82864 Transcript_34540/m.82864 type:complete len:337 (-) Transcript_34540:25-1035(-)
MEKLQALVLCDLVLGFKVVCINLVGNPPDQFDLPNRPAQLRWHSKKRNIIPLERLTGTIFQLHRSCCQLQGLGRAASEVGHFAFGQEANLCVHFPASADCGKHCRRGVPLGLGLHHLLLLCTCSLEGCLEDRIFVESVTGLLPAAARPGCDCSCHVHQASIAYGFSFGIRGPPLLILSEVLRAAIADPAHTPYDNTGLVRLATSLATSLAISLATSLASSSFAASHATRHLLPRLWLMLVVGGLLQLPKLLRFLLACLLSKLVLLRLLAGSSLADLRPFSFALLRLHKTQAFAAEHLGATGLHRTLHRSCRSRRFFAHGGHGPFWRPAKNQLWADL